MSKTTTSDFQCIKCGLIMPLPRTESTRRKNGHIKDLFCPHCKTTEKFKEYNSRQCIKTLSGDFLY